MMKNTVNFCDFVDRFNAVRPDNFTYQGLRALYDWFEEYEEGCDEEVELDVIAICCDFTEYENLEEFQGDYSTEYETIEAIEDEITVIRVGENGFIIQCF